MNQYRKGFVNVVIGILVLVLAGAVGYLTLVKNQTGNAVYNAQTTDQQKQAGKQIGDSNQRDEFRIIDLQTLQLALGNYNNEYKSYPPTLIALVEKYKYLGAIVTGSNTRTPPLYAGLNSSDKNICSGYHLIVIFESQKTFDRVSPPAHALASKNVCVGSNPDFNGTGNANMFDITDSVPLIAK